MTILTNFFQHFINIFVESAPWLLFGYLIAGLIKILIPIEFLHRHLGGNNATAVVKSALLGAPLPLCSCGVIPAALGLRRAGASRASTTSFLIATPETGVDSVFITYALLGPLMAIVRPIAAVVTAITAGLAVMKWGGHGETVRSCNKTVEPATQSSGCCGDKHGHAHKHAHEPASKVSAACCSTQMAEKSESKPADTCCAGEKSCSPSRFARLQTGLQFALIDIMTDTSLWLLIGFSMSALILTILPPSFLTTWGTTPYAYVFMAAIGVPMYICATASTPIAAGLLFAGVSPGAVLVFMLVGPATNLATVTMVKKELGTHTLMMYLLSVVTVGFTFGWLVDYLTRYFAVSVTGQSAHAHGASWFAITSALILAALLLNGLRRKLV